MSEKETEKTIAQAYCVKCRSKREFKEGTEKLETGKRNFLKGLCSVCGTKMSVVVSKKLMEDKTSISSSHSQEETEKHG